MDEREKILQVNNLTVSFRTNEGMVRAVRDISFDLYKGETLAIVGESGSGKSVTARSIMGILAPNAVVDDGSILYGGTDLLKLKEDQFHKYRGNKLGMVFQDPLSSLNPIVKIGKQLTESMRLNEKISKKDAKKRALDLLAGVGISDPERRYDQYPFELSGGMRQRVVIAIALSANPEVLICDEPTTARSIIKLYNITGGKVWFDGNLISSGSWDEKEALRQARSAARKAAPGEAEAARVRLSEAREQYRHALAQEKELKRKYPTVTQIQMIFQDPIASLNPRMTIKEIIAEGLRIRGVRDEAVIDRMVYDVLGKVGLLREHANRYPHEFSGGQRQRIGIARAIIMEPKMIIADEPVSALDVSIQAQVINLLGQLRDDLGLTILFIAHDLSVVKYFSDRIGVMYFGHLVELASSDELFARPLHGYTKALLSAIPLPDPNYEKDRRRINYQAPELTEEEQASLELREIFPGHFVRCTPAQAEQMRGRA